MLRQTAGQKYLFQWRKIKFSVFLTTLVMLWTFGIGMLTMNTFQSLLVTKLTLRKSKPLVDSIEDISKREDIQPIVPREIQIDHVLQNSGIPAYEKAWERINNKFVPMEQVFAFQNLLIVQKGKTCIIHGHLIIKDRLSTFFKKTGSCNMHLSSNYFYPFSLPFALKRNLPQLFLHKFNLGITRLVDADISGKWFKAALKEATLCTSYTANHVKPLGLGNLHGVLLLWGFGLVLASTSLLVEVIVVNVS
ncbi:uncharacterized protein LOC129226644 [Uloborus diversus]|uniref:uncharacterized protein LOC129226644 n=1 Tax=Uloborus diversus TaxID=327109 RepID=UPI00240A7718|nr:uncharacterized protein LOC129226644 [Uloborus diversus]